MESYADIKKRYETSRLEKITYLKRIRDCFQLVMDTDAGKEVLTYLVTESRVFANALKTTSNLEKQYGVGSDYYLGQSDFGKNILSFLTEQQVAELLRRTKKEHKDE